MINNRNYFRVVFINKCTTIFYNKKKLKNKIFKIKKKKILLLQKFYFNKILFLDIIIFK